jgi:hypothetical protein
MDLSWQRILMIQDAESFGFVENVTDTMKFMKFFLFSFIIHVPNILNVFAFFWRCWRHLPREMPQVSVVCAKRNDGTRI